MIVQWKTSGNAFIGDLRIGCAHKEGEQWKFTTTNAGAEMLGLANWDYPLYAPSMSDMRDLIQRRATEYASPR